MSDKASLIRGAFLFCLSHSGNLTIAADFAGTTRAEMAQAIADDSHFAKAVEEALCEAHERVFYQAMMRGLKGERVPRFYQGEVVGYVRLPSDGLLKYALGQLAAQSQIHKSSDEMADQTQKIADLRQQVRAKLAGWLAEIEESDDTAS